MLSPRTLVTAAVVAFGATAAACSLPPVSFDAGTVTVRYSDFLPQGVPIVTGFPSFSDRRGPAQTIPVAREARSVNLSSVTLNLRLQNTGPIPLNVKLYLSPESQDPYATAPLGGENALIELPARSGEVTRSFSIDPALTKQERLKLGYTFSSPGTQESVTIQESDAVIVKTSVAAQVKVL